MIFVKFAVVASIATIMMASDVIVIPRLASRPAHQFSARSRNKSGFRTGGSGLSLSSIASLASFRVVLQFVGRTLEQLSGSDFDVWRWFSWLSVTSFSTGLRSIQSVASFRSKDVSELSILKFKKVKILLYLNLSVKG
jgi:hypothetical protein